MRKKLLGRFIQASIKHKWLLCRTCKKATDKVHCRHGDTLRGKQIGKPRTYSRIIKPSDKGRMTKYHGVPCKQKAIYYSYDLLGCIKKHHKLSVRRAPFSAKGVEVVC